MTKKTTPCKRCKEKEPLLHGYCKECYIITLEVKLNQLELQTSAYEERITVYTEALEKIEGIKKSLREKLKKGEIKNGE